MYNIIFIRPHKFFTKPVHAGRVALLAAPFHPPIGLFFFWLLGSAGTPKESG